MQWSLGFGTTWDPIIKGVEHYGLEVSKGFLFKIRECIERMNIWLNLNHYMYGEV